MEDVRKMVHHNHTFLYRVEFSFVDCLHPEVGGSSLLRNVGKFSPVYRIYPRRVESSINTHVKPLVS